MLKSPECYIMELENASYAELIKERKRLIRSMSAFEERRNLFEKKKKPATSPYLVVPLGSPGTRFPSPEVEYYMEFEYLMRLCKLMQEKFSQLDSKSNK